LRVAAVLGSRPSTAVAPLLPPDFESLYVAQAGFVRRALELHGVREADLDDVLQETFVTIHRLLPDFEGRSSVETWLYAVARRVAANHRRKRRSTAEAFVAGMHEMPEPLVSPDRVQASFARIDEENRDLLALHEIGGLSISSLAELTGRARVTIRHRLERGRAALSRAITSREAPPQRAPWLEQIARRFDAPFDSTVAPPILRALPCGLTCISTIDDLVIAVWRGPASNEGLHAVIEALIAHSQRWPDGIRYLSVVERTSTAPTREGREMTTWVARKLGSKVKAAAIMVEGPALMMLVASVINTSLFLARTPVNMRFFTELPGALAWLAQYGALALPELLDHVESMRSRLA